MASISNSGSVALLVMNSSSFIHLKNAIRPSFWKIFFLGIGLCQSCFFPQVNDVARLSPLLFFF